MHGVEVRRPVGLLLVLCILIAALTQSVAAESPRPTSAERDLSANTNTFRVYAHREGLVGYTTANGHVIQPNDFFVALPCWCSLSSKGGDEFQVKLDLQRNLADRASLGRWTVEHRRQLLGSA